MVRAPFLTLGLDTDVVLLRTSIHPLKNLRIFSAASDAGTILFKDSPQKTIISFCLWKMLNTELVENSQLLRILLWKRGRTLLKIFQKNIFELIKDPEVTRGVQWNIQYVWQYTPPLSRVLTGRHLIFCWLTSPPCCNSPRKCTPVKYKKRQKRLGFQLSHKHRRKKVFLEILQNSQGNTCPRASFLIKLHAWALQLY